MRKLSGTFPDLWRPSRALEFPAYAGRPAYLRVRRSSTGAAIRPTSSQGVGRRQARDQEFHAIHGGLATLTLERPRLDVGVIPHAENGLLPAQTSFQSGRPDSNRRPSPWQGRKGDARDLVKCSKDVPHLGFFFSLLSVNCRRFVTSRALVAP